jgi:hypothetical protein
MILITCVVTKASFERVNMTRAYGKVKCSEEKMSRLGRRLFWPCWGFYRPGKTVKYLKDEGLE